jgi:hypothetical protein
MRHFFSRRLCAPLTPGLLTRGMLARSAPGALVTFTRPAQRAASRPPGTSVRTVEIAVITIAADRHDLRAPSTPIVSVTLLAHGPPGSTLQWTNSGSARITNTRIALLTHRNRKARGQTAKSFSGPSSRSAWALKNNEDERTLVLRVRHRVLFDTEPRRPPLRGQATFAWTVRQLQRSASSMTVGARATHRCLAEYRRRAFLLLARVTKKLPPLGRAHTSMRSPGSHDP